MLMTRMMCFHTKVDDGKEAITNITSQIYDPNFLVNTRPKRFRVSLEEAYFLRTSSPPPPPTWMSTIPRRTSAPSPPSSPRRTPRSPTSSSPPLPPWHHPGSLCSSLAARWTRCRQSNKHRASSAARPAVLTLVCAQVLLKLWPVPHSVSSPPLRPRSGSLVTHPCARVPE